MINISIKSEDLDKALQPILLNPAKARGLMGVIGRGVMNDLKVHFANNQKTKPNKRGFKRQNIWARIARNTKLVSFDDKQATVEIADPAINTKISGATIVAPPKKALAIPISEQAYGHRASERHIPGLFLMKAKSGNAFLVTQNKNAEMKFHYILLKRTVVPEDPDAIPSNQKLSEVATLRAKQFIDKQIRS